MKILAGVDEVGRGSLIGPVFAAAVILNKSINKKVLNDSKKLTKNKREQLNRYIKENSIWAVGRASTNRHSNRLNGSARAQKRRQVHAVRDQRSCRGFFRGGAALGHLGRCHRSPKKRRHS